MKLLHVAPEPVLTRLLTSIPTVTYVTADLCSPRAAVRMDLTQIPFRTEAFDAILCVHVLEHVQDDDRAMRELHRVLRSDGWAILQSPMDAKLEKTFEDPSIISPADRLRTFGQEDHVRIYGRDYGERLAAAGFAVTVDPFVREMNPRLIEQYRLDPNEDVYFCTKSG